MDTNKGFFYLHKKCICLCPFACMFFHIINILDKWGIINVINIIYLNIINLNLILNLNKTSCMDLGSWINIHINIYEKFAHARTL